MKMISIEESIRGGELKEDQSDYIEAAVYMVGEGTFKVYGGPCKQTCRSCGGGCYGSKGSTQSKGAEIGDSQFRSKSDLSLFVKKFLD